MQRNPRDVFPYGTLPSNKCEMKIGGPPERPPAAEEPPGWDDPPPEPPRDEPPPVEAQVLPLMLHQMGARAV